jgi:hypothetical protein
LFWYLLRDFWSLIREFSGGKLKQKGFFHSARPAHCSFADNSINILGSKLCTGATIRPNILVFLFYSFWIFSFSYPLIFLLSFSISSYPFLLISSYSSHRCYSSSSYSSPLIFQTVCCITDMHIS